MKIIIIKHKNEDEVSDETKSLMSDEMVDRIMKKHYKANIESISVSDWPRKIKKVLKEKYNLKQVGGNFSVYLATNNWVIDEELWHGRVEPDLLDDLI